MTCGELTNPTMGNNLECYDLPYIMSDSDKNKLAEYIVNIVTDNGSSYTLSEALSTIDNMLTTGTFEDTSTSIVLLLLKNVLIVFIILLETIIQIMKIQ